MPILPIQKTLRKSPEANQRGWWAVVIVIVIFALALTLRLWLSPSEGYGFDVGTNKGWSYSAVILGPGKSYTQQLKGSMLPNYPPVGILSFYSAGWIYQRTLSPSLDIDAPAFQTIIKLPAIIADLLTAILLGLLIGFWKRNLWLGIAAGALYAFHPATFHLSAHWGQTDSIYSMFLVGAFGAFAYGFPMISGFSMALALLTKLQAAACLPLFVILALKNGWRNAVKIFLGGCIATVLVLTPFWWQGALKDVFNIYTTSVGFYDSVSSAAYNFWWSMYGDAAGNMHDTEILFGIGSYQKIGLNLWFLSCLYGIILFWRFLKPSPKTRETLPVIFFAAAFSIYGFFLWNTQMHERYDFALLPLGFVVAFLNAKSARLYILISAFVYLNFLGWLHAGWIDRAVFDQFPMLDVFIASGIVIFFFLYAGLGWQMRKDLLAAPASPSKIGRIRQFMVRFSLKKK